MDFVIFEVVGWSSIFSSNPVDFSEGITTVTVDVDVFMMSNSWEFWIFSSFVWSVTVEGKKSSSLKMFGLCG